MPKMRKTLFAGGKANRRTTAGAIQGLVISNLEQTLNRIATANEQVAEEVGQIILKNTLPKVPKDSGDLRDSGRVETGQSSSGNTTVRVTFGSAKVDYAVFVHEDMPQGVEKRYTTPGTGPKYLHHGAAESVNEIDSLLQQRLRAVITGGSSTSGSGS